MGENPHKSLTNRTLEKGNARNGRGVANSLFASALANLKKAFVRGKVNKVVEGLCETQFKLQLHNH